MDIYYNKRFFYFGMLVCPLNAFSLIRPVVTPIYSQPPPVVTTTTTDAVVDKVVPDPIITSKSRIVGSSIVSSRVIGHYSGPAFQVKCQTPHQGIRCRTTHSYPRKPCLNCCYPSRFTTTLPRNLLRLISVSFTLSLQID